MFSPQITKWLLLAVLLVTRCCLAEISITAPSNAAPRVLFGIAKLREAVAAATSDTPAVTLRQVSLSHDVSLNQAESFSIHILANGIAELKGYDDSGLLHAALEMTRLIREGRILNEGLGITEKPAMKLRGTCVGLQKTTILPGRKVYEYPYTPELFPWFYDRSLWTEYLDRLVENRMNSLYLWNGHPFSSLVRLKDYPAAIEVPEPVFRQNMEMFHWLTSECDRRGIWLVQMFYNIFLPQPLAEKYQVPTQLSAPTPLASDYTRKAIAEFVRSYPNVGLMFCLGEALQGTSNQVAWATETILPGVHDGMKAAGILQEPPVVIRTHAMDPEAIMPACFNVYSNLFTETKYNGESLTTYEPRGKAQATHLAMAKLGPHLVNVHILSNLEPFRYGAQRFIQKSMLACRDRLGASGLHLYPLAYWNWPYTPDAVNPPLKQWDRDWIWFEAWARYAWNPDRQEASDRQYWTARLSGLFGCNQETAAYILEGINDAGEVAPILVRRFGITEGNRQTLSLGMTLDQLVNPKRYNAITELWESQAPPGERLDEFVQREIARQPHQGETPETAIREVLRFSERATAAFEAAESGVKRNQAEFMRWKQDAAMIRKMAEFYAARVEAARRILTYQATKNTVQLDLADSAMFESLNRFLDLATLTEHAYRFANSMQTGHRKIPFPGAASGIGTNYHWSQVLPLYEQEFREFQAQLAAWKNSGSSRPVNISSWPPAAFKLVGTNAETYEVKVGARPFADRRYMLTHLASELVGLTGIRFSHEAAKNGRYEPVEFEVSQPVRVLIGYFQSDRDLWLQVPNLDVASHADERGGVEPVLRNAAAIEECPGVNVHAFQYEAGRHKLEMIGKGSFVVLGMVPATVKLEKRDAKQNQQ